MVKGEIERDRNARGRVGEYLTAHEGTEEDKLCSEQVQKKEKKTKTKRLGREKVMRET